MTLFHRYSQKCFLCFLFFSILVSCPACDKKQDEQPALKKISIGTGTGNSQALLFFAEEHNFFSDQQLEVTLNKFQSGKAALQSLLDDKFDLATASEFAYVSQSFSHPELRVLCSVAEYKNKELVARLDKGIITPKDLKGKKIGVTRKSGGEYFLGMFLAQNGIRMNEVIISDLKPKQLIEELLAGNLDAVLTWEPYVFNLKKLLAAKAKYWPVQGKHKNYSVLLAKEKWVKNNTETVERLLKNLKQSEEYIQKHPDAVKEFYIRTHLYEKDYVNKIIQLFHFQLGLKEGLLSAMDQDAKWRIDNGLAGDNPVPDYKQYIYFDGLEHVSPDSVTIKH